MFSWPLVFLPTAFLLGWGLCFPQTSALWISQGFAQVTQSLFPSLFLPLVLTNFIFLSPLRQKLEKIFAPPGKLLFAMDGQQTGVMLFGMLCGFPTGILLAKQLYEANAIDKTSYRRLCLLANNCGVGFIFSFLGTHLSFKQAGGIFLSQLVSCVLFSRLLKKTPPSLPSTPSPIPFGYTFGFVNAIKKSVVTLSFMAGFVIFFSFLSRWVLLLAKQVFPHSFYPGAFLGLVLEISGGCGAFFDKPYGDVFCAWAVAWGGVSVWAQSKMAADRAGLPKGYLAFKLLQALTCALFYWVFSFFLL